MMPGWPPVSWEDLPRAVPLSVVTGSSRKVVPRDIATDGAKSGAPNGFGFGPEDLRKIRAMEIRQRRASVSL